MTNFFKICVLSAGFGIAAFLGMGNANAGVILTPQVDFRGIEFAAADNQHSFTSTFDGIEFTLSAFRFLNGETMDAVLWWDARDGIGIRGGDQEDEIDSDEFLKISFGEIIGLSHIFLSDLFLGENFGGATYDEAGAFDLDDTGDRAFTAFDLIDTDGDKSNGEATIVLDKTIAVQEIVLFALDSGTAMHNFSVIGFTDPPVPNGNDLSPIPAPGTLLVFSFGLGLLGFTRRRKAKSLV